MIPFRLLPRIGRPIVLGSADQTRPKSGGFHNVCGFIVRFARNDSYDYTSLRISQIRGASAAWAAARLRPFPGDIVAIVSASPHAFHRSPAAFPRAVPASGLVRESCPRPKGLTEPGNAWPLASDGQNLAVPSDAERGGEGFARDRVVQAAARSETVLL